MKVFTEPEYSASIVVEGYGIIIQTFAKHRPLTEKVKSLFTIREVRLDDGRYVRYTLHGPAAWGVNNAPPGSTEMESVINARVQAFYDSNQELFK